MEIELVLVICFFVFLFMLMRKSGLRYSFVYVNIDGKRKLLIKMLCYYSFFF